MVRTRRCGVTLLEMLVVLVVLGVLLALTVPRAVGAADRAAVRSAAGELVTLFSRARREAVRRRTPVALRLDRTRGAVWLALGDSLLLRRELGASYGVRLVTTRDSMAYDARGLGVGAANLSVRVERGVAAETVVVSRLGRVR